MGCESETTQPELPPLPSRLEATDPEAAQGRDVREFNIVLVGEVRGEIQPCGCPTVPYGGFARRQVFLDEMRAENVPLFQVDAGEALLKGISESGRDRIDARVDTVVSLMREVGVDLMVPGPTDLLAREPEALRAIASSGGPRMVSATWLTQEDKPWFPAAVVLERDGIRLGVIGLSAEPQAPEVRGLVKYRDPVEAAKKAVEALPRDLDLVVAVSNLPETVAERVAGAVPGIAALLSTRGSEHEAPRSKDGGAVIVETPSRGRYVTALRLRLGAPPGEPLVLKGPAVEKLGVLLDLRTGTRGHLEDPDARERVLGRIDELEATLKEAGDGRNLVVIEDRPLGSNLDGPVSSSEVIEKFRETVVGIAVAVAAQEDSGPVYASTATCVSCHMHQFATWAYSKHKNALQSLVERGESDDPECLECHSTGFGEPGGFGELSKFNLSRLGSVQCEACHGPLKGHPEDANIVISPVTESTCTRCHDEANSPDFDMDTYWKKVACTQDPHGLPR